jgi:hypothetical protein
MKQIKPRITNGDISILADPSSVEHLDHVRVIPEFKKESFRFSLFGSVIGADYCFTNTGFPGGGLSMEILGSGDKDLKFYLATFPEILIPKMASATLKSHGLYIANFTPLRELRSKKDLTRPFYRPSYNPAWGYGDLYQEIDKQD